ncbi:hypothetical protein QPM17_14380 [Marinobacter sp. TBZ242]|uniref:Phage integrase family protein n=1 Tax=Marinobacter azerbaijanicus TaxID=3050455 RepID=A0ABT7IF91_9GAMM|nr:hypothetical protein [Marinobacter sp. TBZ242]MDL0432328.1 hypothetical protein [Marinobacter sp. TBZ242]
MAESDKVWEEWQKPLDRLQKSLDRAEKYQLAGSESRRVERVRHKLDHLNAALGYLCKHYPALAAGDQRVEMSDAAVNELINDACQSGTGETIKDKQRYLFLGLTQGVKERDWQLSAPAPILSVRTAPSMFSTAMVARSIDYDALNEQFMATLSEESGTKCKEQDAGELLFSMVFHSTVVSKRRFRRVSAAIRAGIAMEGELGWLELEQAPGDNSGKNSRQSGRRVFLAPVTQLLLRRWFLRWGKDWPEIEDEGRTSADEQLLNAYVDGLVQSTGDRWHRSKDVFALAEANLVELAPGFLVHYARTPDLGVSLPLTNWMRLVTGQVAVPVQSTGPAPEQETHLINAAEIHSPEYPLSDQRPAFRELKHALRRFERQLEVMGKKRGLRGPGDGPKGLFDARGNASKAIRKVASSPKTSVVLQLMCHYAQFLIRQEGLPFAHWRERIRNVARLMPLLDYDAEIQSELSLETDEWQAMYEAVIARTPGDNAVLQATLSDWHEFLHAFYGVERVPLDGGPSYGVDANIVTPREYLQAKQHLMKQAGDELASLQLALLILGYRCGLRRTEAWARQFGDFHGLDHASVMFPEVLVRPTKLAGVKSDSALRRLPLRLLLTSDERIWLADFLRDRKQRRHNDDPRVPLFADPVSGHFRITERMAFEGLTLLMRAVTGDDNFRFHHLRHSFATITLFRLMERKPFELLPANWCPDNDAMLNPGDESTPLWKQAGLGDPCRGLALLTQWMGHSSEKVALRSYAHLLDYLLGWYVTNRINPRLSLDQQASLLDKSAVALERFRHRNGLADRQTPAKRLAEVARMPAKAQFELPRMRNAPENIHVPPVYGKQDINPLLPYRLELQTFRRQAAPQNETEETALRNAAAQLDIEPYIAQQWHERARLLMDEETARRSSKFSLASTAQNPTGLAEHFTLISRAPELRTYPCPPQSRSAFEGVMNAFKRLSIWVSEEPDTARRALLICKKGIQRSHAEVRLQGTDNIPFMRLMKALRLASCLTIEVKTLADNESRSLGFWAHHLCVTKKSINVKVMADQRIPADGNVSLRVTKPGELRSLFWFWSSFRFLIFTGCVLYDAVERDDERNIGDVDS